MVSIHDLQLSELSLLITFILPFAYYGYHAKYWYDGDKIRFGDFLLQVLSFVFGFFIAFKVYHIVREGDVSALPLSLTLRSSGTFLPTSSTLFFSHPLPLLRL
jgi:hypothetical protein